MNSAPGASCGNLATTLKMRATHFAPRTCCVNTRRAGTPEVTIVAQALSLPIADSPVVDAAFKIAFSRFFTSSAGQTHTDEQPFRADDADAATGEAVAEWLRAARADLGTSLKEAVAYERGTVRDMAWTCEDGAAALKLQFLETPPTLAWLRVTSVWPEGSDFRTRLQDALARHGLVPTHRYDAGDGTRVAFATAPRYGGVAFTYRNYGRERLDDVSHNYSPDVVSRVRDVIGLVRAGAHGLIIISGPPGTGKTHLIRAMMTELRDVRRAVVCVPPLEFLSSASLLLEAASSFDRALLVFEDLGDVLSPQAPMEHVDTNAVLLNLSDGLLSLLVDVVVILSFNTGMEALNPALLRPGRCLSRLEVRPLSFHQAQGLLPFPLKAHREYSLAEVYEMRRTGAEAAVTRREMGFATP